MVSVIAERHLKKLDFYATVRTKELLLLDRSPWSLELYRLEGNGMQLVGASAVDHLEILTTEVVPLRWRLVSGIDRPMVEAARLDGTQSWMA